MVQKNITTDLFTMLRLNKWPLIFLLGLCPLAGVAQSFSINADGSTANASAMLDVKSTDKGLLVPRMSKAQKNAIVNPATGLLIFQNAPDSTGFYYYSGSNWLWLTNTTQQDTLGWKTTGNTATNSNTHFLGTINNVPLSFRQNNIWLGRWDADFKNFAIGDSAGIAQTSSLASQNIAIGSKALAQNTAGFKNVAIGTGTLEKNRTGYSNVAIGARALSVNTSGSRNTAVGEFALGTQSYNAGAAYLSDNTAIGSFALFSNQPTSTANGTKNVAVGNDALYENTTGSENVAVGVSALRENVAGGSNTAVGRNAMLNHRRPGNSYNTAVGAAALEQDTAGLWNTGVGTSAFRRNMIGVENTGMGINMGYNQLGSYNTFAGSHSGFGNRIVAANYTNNTGQYNSGFGYNSLYSLAGGTGNVAMGSQALYSDSSGAYNTGVGNAAGFNITTAGANVAIGYHAMFTNDASNFNTAVGSEALLRHKLNGAAYNTAVGASALEQDSSGFQNTGIGTSSFRFNKQGAYNAGLGINSGYYQKGSDNTFIGAYAGYGERINAANVVLDIGIKNTGLGAGALYRLANGNYNVAIGQDALLYDSSGSYNVALGHNSLPAITSGTYNVGLGYNTNAGAGTLTNTITIGANAYVTQSNSLILGSINGVNGATANTSVGIGTTAPTARLDVDANFKLGNNGTLLNEIIKSTETYDIPSLAPGAVDIQIFAVANATLGSAVFFSPLSSLPDGITISYARVSAAGLVEVKVVNAGTATQNPASTTFYIGIIR